MLISEYFVIRNTGRNELPRIFVFDVDFLFLIRFFLAHNRLDHFMRKLSFIGEFLHLDCLGKRRCSVRIRDFFEQRSLFLFFEVGQFNCRSERNTALINKLEQFGDKLS